jgi:hypothetical protein
MNATPGCFLGIAFCCGVFLFGRYSIARPEGVARVFAWGQPPTRFGVVFFRLMGRTFCWMGAIGVVFYLIATTIAFFTH